MNWYREMHRRKEEFEKGNYEKPWTCKCNYMNTGPICTHCGAGKTEKDE